MKLKPNIGTIDRTVRLLIAILCTILFYIEAVDGVLSVVVLMVALVLTATCLISFCPLYSWIKVSTVRAEKSLEG